MKHWDPNGPAAPVTGVPDGCKAVGVVELVERDGELDEVRDRRGRAKLREVVLVADPQHPPVYAPAAATRFATATGRRQWKTVLRRFGDDAFALAVTLVRAGVVHVGCDVDDRGRLGEPRWWRPTESALQRVDDERSVHADHLSARVKARDELMITLREPFPGLARALSLAESPVVLDVLMAAATDLLEGVTHAGPRAFVQAHFEHTKAHDVRGILTAAGAGDEVFDRLGLRRGDRIGFGGPIQVSTADGQIDLAPLRGPVNIRLDQPALDVTTEQSMVVVIENLQPAEAVCAQFRDLPIVYTAGQFGDDASRLLRSLGNGRRLVAITDADLGGVRIAHRLLLACPHAEVVDVGCWPHPTRDAFPKDATVAKQLERLTGDALVGRFARAILKRGYPVEQEIATVEIIRELIQ